MPVVWNLSAEKQFCSQKDQAQVAEDYKCKGSDWMLKHLKINCLMLCLVQLFH